MNFGLLVLQPTLFKNTKLLPDHLIIFNPNINTDVFTRV